MKWVPVQARKLRKGDTVRRTQKGATVTLTTEPMTTVDWRSGRELLTVTSADWHVTCRLDAQWWRKEES